MASLGEIAKWHTIIGGGAQGAMEMKYENRLCDFTLQVGDAPPSTGIAYNEVRPASPAPRTRAHGGTQPIPSTTRARSASV